MIITPGADAPIEPTQVALAGELLPAPAAPRKPPPPPPPVAPPPWWSAPPPSGPPAGLPAEVHHYVHVVLPEPAPLVVPTRGFDWSRLWSWLTGKHGAGAGIALAPVFGGWSLATGWGAVLRACREQQSIGGAWVMAVTVLGVAILLTRPKPSWAGYALLTTCIFGTAYMASPYDIVTLLTGVHL